MGGSECSQGPGTSEMSWTVTAVVKVMCCDEADLNSLSDILFLDSQKKHRSQLSRKE